MIDETRGPTDEPRPAKDVIEQAIAENRRAEVLLCVFACVVVTVGVGVLIYGVVSGQAVVALAGAISSSLFVPAMAYAKRIRKENMAIRLLEDPLTKAETASDAADAIRVSFLRLSSEEPSQKRKEDHRSQG